MLIPISDSLKTRIIKNILNACKDINKLSKTGYDYIYLASGFIAHYDLQGFRAYYEEPDSLRKDILANESDNRYDNFRPGEENYEYYHQKAEIYREICEKLRGGIKK